MTSFSIFVLVFVMLVCALMYWCYKDGRSEPETETKQDELPQLVAPSAEDPGPPYPLVPLHPVPNVDGFGPPYPLLPLHPMPSFDDSNADTSPIKQIGFVITDSSALPVANAPPPSYEAVMELSFPT